MNSWGFKLIKSDCRRMQRKSEVLICLNEKKEESGFYLADNVSDSDWSRFLGWFLLLVGNLEVDLSS